MSKPVVTLLHNPKAGKSDHSKDSLVDLVTAKGYKCHYASIKKDGWDKINPDTGFIVVAGGDGAVRKVVSRLLRRRVYQARYPLTILPLGTANNIARTLQIHQDVEATVGSWQSSEQKKFDIGIIDGLEYFFFMESLGFGIFPMLIDKMAESGRNDIKDIDKRIHTALETLLRITEEYKANDCKLTIDGKDHTGKYLLVEIMNTGQVGPNLNLNPLADTADGLFDVVLVREHEQELLCKYVEDKLKGIERPLGLETIQGKTIHVSWGGTNAHVDDATVTLPDHITVDIHMRAGILDFMVPKQDSAGDIAEPFV